MSTDEIRCGWKKNKFTIVPLVYQDGKQIKEYNVILVASNLVFKRFFKKQEQAHPLRSTSRRRLTSRRRSTSMKRLTSWGRSTLRRRSLYMWSRSLSRRKISSASSS